MNHRKVQKIEETMYMKKIRAILQFSEKKMKEGISFPIWGTCLGFESMLVNYFNYSISLASGLDDFKVIDYSKNKNEDIKYKKRFIFNIKYISRLELLIKVLLIILLKIFTYY